MRMMFRLAPSGEARFLMPKSRRALPLALFVVACALLVGAGSASAAIQSKCAAKLLNDYVGDGRVDGTYPVHCYREALKSIPEDLDVYGSARADLTRALLGILPGSRGGGDSNSSGGASSGSIDNLPPNKMVPGQGTTKTKKDEGFFYALAHKLGPGNASSIPLPLLILAGVGLLLVAAAGASYTARWIHARRAHPHPATSPPAPRRK
jgi:hypothetical protein